MTAEDSYLTLCRLLAAWVNRTAAGAAPADFDALLRAAKEHMLSAAACAAMEAAGWMELCPPEIARQFQTAKMSAIRKTLLMDAERGAILAALEEMGIWYMPLKGIVVNAIYPQYGTRQFSDNDILFDAARWEDMQNLLQRRGYEAISVGHGFHDVYHKLPIYSFEMHRQLFAENNDSDFLRTCTAYYSNVQQRLIKDDGNGFGYHFCDEDFYIYSLAHAYKHFRGGGTGLRTLLDAHLYRRAKPEMDGAYIAEELRKLGLAEFEATLRTLAEKLFGAPIPPALTEAEQEMFAWLESSGVYGTVEHSVYGDLRRMQGGTEPINGRTRARYLLRWVFPDREWCRAKAPFVHRHPWIMPFFWLYRMGRGVFVNGRKNLKILAAATRKQQAAGEEPRR